VRSVVDAAHLAPEAVVLDLHFDLAAGDEPRALRRCARRAGWGPARFGAMLGLFVAAATCVGKVCGAVCVCVWLEYVHVHACTWHERLFAVWLSGLIST
jgi:hypothetical protein